MGDDGDGEAEAEMSRRFMLDAGQQDEFIAADQRTGRESLLRLAAGRLTTRPSPCAWRGTPIILACTTPGTPQACAESRGGKQWEEKRSA